jgi:hypothetical protein
LTVHVGSGCSSLSCGVFIPPPLLQTFLLLVAGHAPTLPPSPARPSLFIYSSVRDSPPCLFGAQDAPPSLLHVFIILIVYCSVSLFFFPLGGGRSVQGAMLLWPGLSVGVPRYRLAHLVRVLPSHPGAGIWWPGGPPGFSIQREVESVALPARCVSSVSPRFHFRRHTFCFLPLAAMLEFPQCKFKVYLV